MVFLALVFAPFLAVILPFLAARRGQTWIAVATAVAPLIGLGLLLSQTSQVLAGEVISVQYAWITQLGLNLSFRLDGLSYLFSLLILGIGLLVILYARYYLSEQERVARFFTCLLLFMGSMLGLVLAGNLLLMLMFWELTSLSSFLLIGFWSHQTAARQGARMALAVTGGGGLDRKSVV